MKKHAHACLSIVITAFSLILAPRAQAAFHIKGTEDTGDIHVMYADPSAGAVIDTPEKEKTQVETEDPVEKPKRHHASGFAAIFSVICGIAGLVVLPLISVPTTLLALALGFAAVIAGAQGLKHYKDNPGYKVLSIIGIVMGISALLLGADYLLFFLR